ncbi:MAG: dihydropteroate synthase [Candidatus Thermoplasmatota archaeon]|nr:dihydropteroate synthase [Candidatus Thermoplasmatota archaeon]
MGVINCTPDSFYEGSRSELIEHSLKIVEKMIREGADWLDIGGESTRPGATEVSIDEEIRRTVPLILEIRKRFPNQAISIDTRRYEVAKEAIIAGANMINDVSGLRDSKMFELVLSTGAHVCIMHMQGNPSNMQNSPNYTDVVQEVTSDLLRKARRLVEEGHPVNRICLDPGIGFGKTLEHNISLLRNSEYLRGDEGFSILWGVSRKSMFRELLGREDTNERLAGTLGVAAYAQSKGIDILRVHDVAEHADIGRTISKLELN